MKDEMHKIRTWERLKADSNEFVQATETVWFEHILTERHRALSEPSWATMSNPEFFDALCTSSSFPTITTWLAHPTVILLNVRQCMGLKHQHIPASVSGNLSGRRPLQLQKLGSNKAPNMQSESTCRFESGQDMRTWVQHPYCERLWTATPGFLMYRKISHSLLDRCHPLHSA
jgi:hypothetical protein